MLICHIVNGAHDRIVDCRPVAGIRILSEERIGVEKAFIYPPE